MFLDQPEMGGDYNRREAGHWLVDDLVATPMSIYPEYRDSRDSWGMGVLGSILVEMETDIGRNRICHRSRWRCRLLPDRTAFSAVCHGFGAV